MLKGILSNRTCLLEGKKDVCKLVRNPYTRAVSSFLLLADNPYASPQWESIRQYLYNDKYSNRGISFKQFFIILTS
ncbi:hypothetical protein ACT4UM_22440, partial [Bacillus sp. SS-TM]